MNVSVAHRTRAEKATHVVFFVSGFILASWAPLIPFAKTNVEVSEGQLGLLLLALGVGSLTAMPFAGWMSSRYGAKLIVLVCSFSMVAIFPVLLLVNNAAGLAAALFFFGACVGSLDVSMNIHAAVVEKMHGKPLMSGFHARFSVGGLVGATAVTGFLKMGLAPFASALLASVIAVVLLTPLSKWLVNARDEAHPAFVAPHISILPLAVFAAIMFLVEGAMLDWGALLLVDRQLLSEHDSGLGYMMFSLAMVFGRLSGDRTVSSFGPRRVLIWGGVIAIAGILVIAFGISTWHALVGFALVGLGAANIVPVVFSLAGRQTKMSPSLALAAVATVAYSGILIGPAVIGLIAEFSSLSFAFVALAALVVVIPLFAARA